MLEGDPAGAGGVTGRLCQGVRRDVLIVGSEAVKHGPGSGHVR